MLGEASKTVVDAAEAGEHQLKTVEHGLRDVRGMRMTRLFTE